MEEEKAVKKTTEKTYTKEQVDEIIKRRVEKTHNAFFQRYGVKDLEGLDEIVDLGYRYKETKQTNEEPKSYSKDLTLYELIGLNNVKNKIERLAALMVKNNNHQFKPSMNYVFLGNPGTGKTVAARALKDVFFEKGIIKENKIIEVDRSSLVGQYIGQTSPKVKKLFEEALGGVLFIDEAYLLKADVNDSKDYCNEVLMMLNKMMEDYKGELVVILAGYKEETLEMLKGNKGLKSRINAYFDFPNYTKDELRQILNLLVEKYEYKLDEETKEKILMISEAKRNRRDYSNAREIRNIFEGVLEYQAFRTIDEPWNRTIVLEDLLKWQIDNGVVIDSDLFEA